MFDPFLIFKHYDNYYGPDQLYPVTTDYAVVQNYLNRFPEEQYDAYIFGSSAAINYHLPDWVKHLDEPVKPYHFAVGGESLFGIERKIAYIRQHELPLKHALISLEYYSMKYLENPQTLIRVKHPKMSGQARWKFNLMFLKGYFKDWFVFRFLHYKLTGNKELVYQNKVRANAQVTCLPKTNDIYYTWWEDWIERDSVEFFTRPIFQRLPNLEQTPHFTEVLFEKGEKLLQSMRTNLEALETEYVIVIPPFFKERGLHPNDLERIIQVFGKERVFDYSTHPEFREMKDHFYDPTHCRPEMGRLVMEAVYE